MGAMVTAAVITAAATVYSGQQAKKQNDKNRRLAQQQAERGTVTTSTPYMNDVMSQMSPYVLQEALSQYNRRTAEAGHPAGNNQYIQDLLTGIQNNRNYNPLSDISERPVQLTPEQRAAIQQRMATRFNANSVNPNG